MKSAALGLALLALAATGCGNEKSASPAEASSCADVFYEGDGQPDAIVVSDLPRRGFGQATSTLMVEAIKFVLRERRFKAGDFQIGYQSCNDTVGDEPYDRGLCERNAKAYVAADDVLGVIGPWNSGCAIVQLPILSRKRAGPLALVSPANTYTGLTRKTPGAGDAPEVYYPDGVRNYVRLVPPDDEEGTAVALLAKQLGAKRAVVVAVADDYAQGVSRPFLATARGLGLNAREFEWRPQKTYSQLARRVAKRRPQFVYLAGVPNLNGRRLLEDLRAELGPNVPFVGTAAFFMPDTTELGPAAEGMRIAAVGMPAERLPPAGQSFLRDFGKPAFAVRQGYGAPEAAQSAEVLLDAIGRSDGSRESVVDELFRTRVQNGILGSFAFDRNGDITPAAVGFFEVEDGKAVVDRVVRVPDQAD